MGLRLLLAYVLFPAQGFEGDLELHTRWLVTLSDVGPGAFYGHSQDVLPPVFPWLLWPLAIVGRWVEVAAGIPLESTAWALVKVPALVADALIALLLVRVVGRWAGPRAGLLSAALFLFVPVTWYESALWGQIDSVGSLLVLFALVALDLDWSEASVASAVSATLLKPQFGIALIVIGLVLARRHLFSDTRRLLLALGVGAAVGLLILLPFDLEERAPPEVQRIPVVGDMAGLLTIVGQQAGKDRVLVANAFTPWALVGPDPLPRSGIAHWTGDDLHVVDDTTAFTVGLSLTVIAFLVGGALVLIRPDRPATWLAGLVFLTVALFLLATRVHERYVFPVFVIAAPLAAVSRAWRLWYLLVGLATAANLQAVLVYGGTLGVTNLAFGHALQSATSITILAIAQGALGIVVAALVLGGVAGPALAGRTLPPDRGGVP